MTIYLQQVELDQLMTILRLLQFQKLKESGRFEQCFLKKVPVLSSRNISRKERKEFL